MATQATLGNEFCEEEGPREPGFPYWIRSHPTLRMLQPDDQAEYLRFFDADQLCADECIHRICTVQGHVVCPGEDPHTLAMGDLRTWLPIVYDLSDAHLLQCTTTRQWGMLYFDDKFQSHYVTLPNIPKEPTKEPTKKPTVPCDPPFFMLSFAEQTKGPTKEPTVPRIDPPLDEMCEEGSNGNLGSLSWMQLLSYTYSLCTWDADTHEYTNVWFPPNHPNHTYGPIRLLLQCNPR